MDLFNVVALLIVLTALFAYLNHRTLRLPTTIGVMGFALLFSLVLIALGRLGLVGEAWTAWFREVDFGPTLLQGMLGFLLFAGALHVDLNDLLDQKWVVTFLATVGVAFSTAAIGVAAWLILGAVGQNVSSYTADQAVVQRYMTTPDVRRAAAGLADQA